MAQTRWLFHCHCKIKVPLHHGEGLLDDCFAIMEQADRLYNSYQSGSFFDRINQQAGTWVTVDEATIKLLQTLKRISVLTDGAYAISSMPLLQGWGFYGQDGGRIPTPPALRDALSRVDDEAIELESDRVRIAKGQSLITGSFAKAIAADRVIAHLRAQGVTDAIVNAGGSTICALNDASHPQWHVRVPDPLSAEQAQLRLPLANACFSLSGSANNHLVIDDKRYSHIVHGRTGWPADTRQVLLRTADAFLGDALSTAIFVLTPSQRDAVIAKLAQEFSFSYRRVEEQGKQIQSTCF